MMRTLPDVRNASATGLSKRRMMKTILTVLAGLLGTGFLAYVCATGHRDPIQQDLSDRTRRALAESAVSDLRVSADGRDITLLGTVPSAEAKLKAEETARKIYGVHLVTNLLAVREATVAPVPPPVTVSPGPDAGSIVPQPTVVPPKPAFPPERQKSVAVPSPSVKTKPALPQAPAKRESRASLTPAAETDTPRARCQDALATALGRRQIHFESNRAVIRPVSHPVLDRLADAAKSCPTKKIGISGHTDPRGEARRNMALSKSRAQAVINYLVKQGVPAKRLTAVGLGSSKPVTSNTTEAGRQRNRRVEFSITGP